jgi:hypothetical protein
MTLTDRVCLALSPFIPALYALALWGRSVGL